MRDPKPFTPEEAEQARAYLREHASPIQQKLLENGDTDDKGRQLFLIVDTFDAEDVLDLPARAAGEEGFYVTADDELIVDYWRYLIGPDELPDRIQRLFRPRG